MGEEELYELRKLEALHGGNYVSILGLGEVVETVDDIEFEGRMYRTEETSEWNATFVLNDENVVISGEYTQIYDYKGERVEALSRIYINDEGKHMHKITSNHDAWVNPLSDTENEDEEANMSWFHSVARRSLGGSIEFSVQWYYTPKALQKAGSLDVLKTQVLQATADSNIVFRNSGLDITQTVAGIQRWGSSHPIRTGEYDWIEDFVGRFNENDRRGDIVTLIVDWSEGPKNVCGMARVVPEMWDPMSNYDNKAVFYSKSTAFLINQYDCLNDGKYVVTHEMGHLLGLGHNKGTQHCNKDGHNGCGTIVKCGDADNGGVKTIMSYASAQMHSAPGVVVSTDKNNPRAFPCTQQESGWEMTIPYFSSPNVWYRNNSGISYRTGDEFADSRSQIQKAMIHVPHYAAGIGAGKCNVIPQKCEIHIDYAVVLGSVQNPHWYGGFQEVTNVLLKDATRRSMAHYFHCQGFWGKDCHAQGLTPACCGGRPCACDLGIISGTPQIDLPFSSYIYKEGENDQWCKNAGHPYYFTRGNNELYEGCHSWCCKARN